MEKYGKRTSAVETSKKTPAPQIADIIFLTLSLLKLFKQLLCIHQSGVSSTIFKKLTYPGQNRDVRKILRNLIG